MFLYYKMTFEYVTDHFVNTFPNEFYKQESYLHSLATDGSRSFEVDDKNNVRLFLVLCLGRLISTGSNDASIKVIQCLKIYCKK